MQIGCWPYRTNNEYSADWRVGYSTSKPIYFSIKNTKNSTIYALLERDMNQDRFFIKIRWISKNKVLQFKKTGSRLSFLIDRSFTMHFLPIKPSRIASYHIDPPATEEESVYEISRTDLARISQAEYVTMKVEGIIDNKVATFNSFHTFKAFRDFLSNS